MQFIMVLFSGSVARSRTPSTTLRRPDRRPALDRVHPGPPHRNAALHLRLRPRRRPCRTVHRRRRSTLLAHCRLAVHRPAAPPAAAQPVVGRRGRPGRLRRQRGRGHLPALQLRWIGHRLQGNARIHVADISISAGEALIAKAPYALGHALPNPDSPSAPPQDPDPTVRRCPCRTPATGTDDRSAQPRFLTVG